MSFDVVGDVPGEDVEVFRKRLRVWIEQHLSTLSRTATTEQSRRETSRLMYDAGLLGLTWPVQFGGRGLTAQHQTVWNEEMGDHQWALPYSAVTVGICAPTLRDFGTPDQRRRHIPRMLRGDERWTQLLSEPGAGSDLAGVSTAAVQEGTDFIVTGQKVWTSAAPDSDFAIALVRTSREARRHDGLTMLVVDLRAPGVDIRPLKEINGDSDFFEVFLDSVRIPQENLVGEVGFGWRVLVEMLGYERLALGAGTTGGRMDDDVFDGLVDLSIQQGTIRSPHIAHALLDVYIEQRILDLNGIRIRRSIEKSNSQGPIGSIVKVGTASAAETAARATALVVGAPMLAFGPDDDAARDAVHALMTFPMMSIAGGTTEIQKNAIAERLMGLPRG